MTRMAFNSCVRFVHLTDTHIAVGPGTIQFGVDTSQTLEALLAEIVAINPPPDFALISGDLVNDGRSESYEVFRDMLRRLQFPVHLALGNHDRRATFRQVVLGVTGPSDAPYCYTFRAGGSTFVVLDSYLEGTSAGTLDLWQQTWLLEQLARCQERVVVCIHHHVVPTNLVWLDRLILREGEEFARTIQKHPGVQLVIFGHIHRPFDDHINATRLLGTPSTCYQFGPRSETREIATAPPAYRLVTLTNEQVLTEVHWLTKSVPTMGS
jgi:3',5'-cyclic-AMP phosphodiesterase